MRSHGIRQVSGRRTCDRVEAESLRLGERHSNHPVLETQRWEADSIILDVEVLRGSVAVNLVTGQPRSQTRSLKQRRESDGESRLEARRQRQQFGIAPHVRRALRNAFPAGLYFVNRALGERGLNGIVVVSDFERRETLVADRPRLVAPTSSTFPTTQFVLSLTVVIRHRATRFLSQRIAGDEPGKSALK